MSDSPRTSEAAHTLNSKELEAGQLYAVFADKYGIGSWAFFVPNPTVSPMGAVLPGFVVLVACGYCQRV